MLYLEKDRLTNRIVRLHSILGCRFRRRSNDTLHLFGISENGSTMKRSGGNGEDFGRMGKEGGFWEEEGKEVFGDWVGGDIGTRRG